MNLFFYFLSLLSFLETLLNTRNTEEMVYDLSLHVEKLEKQNNEIEKSLLALRAEPKAKEVRDAS